MESNKGIAINGELLIIYVKKQLQETNNNLPDVQEIFLKISKGWMERFKKRCNLSFRRIHGETMSANNVSIREKMPRIMQLISTYAERDV